MYCTYFLWAPHGKTTESYSYKMHSCNLSVRPHGFQQRHKLWGSERMECFKNPLWSSTYMASFISKYLHAACGLQEYVVLCVFEKKRENLSPLFQWSLNVRLCVCILFLSSKMNACDINTITGVLPHLKWCVWGRLVSFWETQHCWH